MKHSWKYANIIFYLQQIGDPARMEAHDQRVSPEPIQKDQNVLFSTTNHWIWSIESVKIKKQTPLQFIRSDNR